MEVIVKESALKDLKKLDKKWQAIVLETLEQMAGWSNEILISKSVKLSGLKKTLYRVRIRDYRAILSIEYQDNKIFVLRILDRKEAYKDTSSF